MLKALFSLLLIGLALIAIASLQWGRNGTLVVSGLVFLGLIVVAGIMMALAQQQGSAMAIAEPD